MKKLFILSSIAFLFFLNCGEKGGNDKTGEQLNDYLKKGQDLALKTQSALGSQLVQALAKGGTDYAVRFCNTAAIPITDSVSKSLNAHIVRVSDRPRNPENAANKEEMEYIKKAKELLVSGEEISPAAHKKGNKVIGYYPIITNAMCLQCHGTPHETIADETWTNLRRLYPEDKAFGYGPDEIRGIFVVEMQLSNQ